MRDDELRCPGAVPDAQTSAYWDQEIELVEARSELARHHSDFERISGICQQALDQEISMLSAVKQIRSIVG